MAVVAPETRPRLIRRRRPRPPRLRWWREVLYILAFYSVYTLIRNQGVATESVDLARRHASDVIRIERALGSFHEETIQEWFLRWPNFIKFWNVYYGSFHFIVTVVALVYMFRRMSARYPLWRNTLAFTTGLALFGFAFYPLMPPRLLPASYGFVDTLKDIGGLWSFDKGAVAKVSNQYAAMPSLHFAWSAWCAFVLLPALRRRWARALMIAYPFLTLFAIVVTANHYWLDAAGGAVTLSVGFVLGRWLTRYLADRGEQPAPHPDEGIEPLPEEVPEPAAPAARRPAGRGPRAQARRRLARLRLFSGPVAPAPAARRPVRRGPKAQARRRLARRRFCARSMPDTGHEHAQNPGRCTEPDSPAPSAGRRPLGRGRRTRARRRLARRRSG